MSFPNDRPRSSAPSAKAVVMATVVVLLATASAPMAQARQASPSEIYREPDDPALAVLARAGSRIFSDDPKDYTAEASERGLRELDQAIRRSPADPRLHWYRYLTLDRMKRTAEGRAAREEAIRLARIVPGGDDLLREYYGEHAVACAKESDAAAAAATLIALLDLTPRAAYEYRSVVIWLGDRLRGDPDAPGPGPLFPGRARLELLWGPLDQFFETHGGPTDARALERVAAQVHVGMDYREVARKVGFANFSMGSCHWDHGIPVMDDCWWYKIAKPADARPGKLVGAEQFNHPTIVHVVIVDQRVRKVEITRADPPQHRRYRHQERASFDCKDGIEGLAFSPDGRLIAVGDMSGLVHLRESRHGLERSVLRFPDVETIKSPGFVVAIAFSPDGKNLASGGTYDATARLWDVAGGRLLASLESFPVPKNRGRMDCIKSLAFAPDGKTIATGGYDRDLRLWDVATGQLRAALRGHVGALTAVAYSPDGRTIATGDDYGTVRLWDVATNRPRARWPGYEKDVVDLAFSPDGKTLAVARDDGAVRLRDLGADRWRAEIPRSQPHNGQSLAFSPDGKTLAIAGAWDVATLWDTATGRMTGMLEGHARSLTAVAYSPDGKTIATGSDDSTLKLWDAPAPAAPNSPAGP